MIERRCDVFEGEYPDKTQCKNEAFITTRGTAKVNGQTGSFILCRRHLAQLGSPQGDLINVG